MVVADRHSRLHRGGSCFFMPFRSRTALNRLIAELDQQRPGWRLAEIEAARPDYPPEQNAATKILAIKALETPALTPLDKLERSASARSTRPKLLNDQQLDAAQEAHRGFVGRHNRRPEADRLSVMAGTPSSGVRTGFRRC